MSTPEQSLYRLLAPNLPGIVERIENAAGAGTPDFFCLLNGDSYWVEVKVAKSPNYEVHRLLEPSQHAWRHRHISNGGSMFFVVRYRDEITLFDGHFNVVEKITKPFSWKHFQQAIHIKLIVDNG